MDLNNNAAKKEKTAEIKNKYSRKSSWHSLLFNGSIYRETADTLYKSPKFTIDPSGYLIQKSVGFYVFGALMMHILQFLVFWFSVAESRSNIIQIFFQLSVTLLCISLWKDALDRSIQLKIDINGIDIVYQGIFIKWEGVLTTHILTFSGGRYKDRHFLVINYYLPSLNAFREIKVNLTALQTSVEKVAYIIEYFKTQNARDKDTLDSGFPSPYFGNLQQEQTAIFGNEDRSSSRLKLFERPFSFEGRIGQKEYVLTLVMDWLSIPVLMLVDRVVHSAILVLFFIILLAWFGLAHAVKRSHDCGRSGWWLLIPFYAFWLAIEEGQPGPNQYGPDPRKTDLPTG